VWEIGFFLLEDFRRFLAALSTLHHAYICKQLQMFGKCLERKTTGPPHEFFKHQCILGDFSLLEGPSLAPKFRYTMGRLGICLECFKFLIYFSSLF
jgi:hypothetical protein